MVNKEITKIYGDVSIAGSLDPSIYGEGNLHIDGNLDVSGSLTCGSAAFTHSSFSGLSSDDHAQYLLLAGRSGGQTVTGGTISGEHGIGVVQRPYMDVVFPETTLDLMRSIKKVFDPKGILNPGKIF